MFHSTYKMQQLESLLLLLLISLIAMHNGDAQVATAGVNHENNEKNNHHTHQHQQQQQLQQQQKHQQKYAEPRQFDVGFGGSGFNANAAFNSTFGSSNFGLNFIPNSLSIGNQLNSGNYRPTTTTTSAPQTFQNQYNYPNNFNSIPNHSTQKKEPNKNVYNDYNNHNQKYPGTRVIDRYDHHYPDGSYEYRYELSDGTARYERGYFLLYANKKTLVVVGYYSYRMNDGRYITVFYNADQNGYRQNQSITPQSFPNLPRSIDVPQFRNSADDSFARETTTTSPRLTTTTETKRSGRF